MKLTASMDYRDIEAAIKPYHFSIRETVEPLHLHKFGLPLHKFTRKQDLVDYLNIKIGAMAA